MDNYFIKFALECMMLEGDAKAARIQSLIADAKRNELEDDKRNSLVIVEDPDSDGTQFRIIKLVDGVEWTTHAVVQECDFEEGDEFSELLALEQKKLGVEDGLDSFLKMMACWKASDISKEEYDDQADVWLARPKYYEEGFNPFKQVYWAKNREKSDFDQFVMQTEAA